MRIFLRVLATLLVALPAITFGAMAVTTDLMIACQDVTSLAQFVYRWVVPPEFVRRARAFERANVERDVEWALARGDRRLVGIAGVAVFFPGFEPNDASVWQVASSQGYVFVPGTSDAIASDEQARLHRAAYDYAHRYNTILWPEVAKNSQVGLKARPVEALYEPRVVQPVKLYPSSR